MVLQKKVTRTHENDELDETQKEVNKTSDRRREGLPRHNNLS